MTTTTPVGYLYRDEYYCPGCIVEAATVGSTQDERDEPERSLNSLAFKSGSPHTITSGQLDEPAPLCETCRTEIR